MTAHGLNHTSGWFDGRRLRGRGRAGEEELAVLSLPALFGMGKPAKREGLDPRPW